MMYFKVTVRLNSVTIAELKDEQKSYDISASVDGEIYRYRIVKARGGDINKHWHERGYSAAHYHANNSGYNVYFREVYHVKQEHKSKRHPNQIELF